MPNLTAYQLNAITETPANIRNVCIAADIDQVVFELTESLISRAGITVKEEVGFAQLPDRRDDSQDRTVSIPLAVTPLYFRDDYNQISCINLVQPPIHTDMSSEATALMRILDGLVVVIDCIQGCGVRSETTLRHALAERVKPCVFLDKVDRCILEMEMDLEVMYGLFRNSIESINVIISTYRDEVLGSLAVSPHKGDVVFGTGLGGWGFNLERFAKIYASRIGVAEGRVTKRLWGDHFYDARNKAWTQKMEAEGREKPFVRGFCAFILSPIKSLMFAIISNDKLRYEKIIDTLGIKLSSEDERLIGKSLMKCIMQRWINGADTLLTMIVTKLPSPQVAQTYRYENLYEGPMHDEAASALRSCDKGGSLMIYVPKCISSYVGRSRCSLFSLGRVFSGTIESRQKVRLQGPRYKPGCTDDLYINKIQRVGFAMGRKVEWVHRVACGNIIVLTGVDSFLPTSGTITTIEDAYNIKAAEFSISDVVRVHVAVTNPSDLPKLVEGLRRLSKISPSVVCSADESGQHVIAGSDELSLGMCMDMLREDCSALSLVVSDPFVSYRETVVDTSNRTCMARSSNKHNRLYINAEPLSVEFVKDVEDRRCGPRATDSACGIRLLKDKHNFSEDEVNRVWCWGLETCEANILVDQTFGTRHLSQIKEWTTRAVHWVASEGPLCGESMRGVRFNLVDATLHEDAIHRGGGQIVPTARRCCCAAVMTAKPTLQEPVFLLELTCPSDEMTRVYECLNARRGYVVHETHLEGSMLVKTRAFLPASHSLGFTASLRRALSYLVFDHFETVRVGDFDTPGSELNELILSIRKRKGLGLSLPALSQFRDNLSGETS